MAIETVECFIHGIKGVVYSFITKSGLFLLSVCAERFSLKFRVCVKIRWIGKGVDTMKSQIFGYGVPP